MKGFISFFLFFFTTDWSDGCVSKPFLNNNRISMQRRAQTILTKKNQRNPPVVFDICVFFIILIKKKKNSTLCITYKKNFFFFDFIHNKFQRHECLQLQYSVCFYVKSKLLYHNSNPVLTTGILNTIETYK